MRHQLTPVVSFNRPDSQNRIIIPQFLVDVSDQRKNPDLIVAKLRKDVGDIALYFLGIIDPSSEYGEDIAAIYGSLLKTRPTDNKRRLIIPKELTNDPALSFLDKENASPLAMSLLPDEGGIFAGREDEVLATIRAQR